MVFISIWQRIYSLGCLYCRFIGSLLSIVLLAFIIFYRYCISPFLAPNCRYKPTCSAYGMIAIKRFGPVIGVYLTIKRILKCNPWGGHGYDPVPKVNKNK